MDTQTLVQTLDILRAANEVRCMLNARGEDGEHIHALNRGFNNELWAIYHASYPRRKKIWANIYCLTPGVEEIRAKWQARADEYYTVLKAFIDSTTRQIEDMCEEIDPVPTEEFVFWKQSLSYTYSSSGLSANGYAKKGADDLAALAAKSGIEAEIRVDRKQYIPSRDWYGHECGMTWIDYGVYVKTNKLGRTILSFRKSAASRRFFEKLDIRTAA